jgi:hypothetical protein
MKKIIFLMLGAALTTGAFAQTTKKEETRNLENKIADKKEDKHEAGKDLENGRIRKAVKGRKEVRSHRRTIHRMGKHLEKAHGVQHPIHKAKVEVKKEKDIRQGNN